VFLAGIIPVIILGGIYGGIFTSTEYAVAAILYSLVVGVFVYKELDAKSIPDAVNICSCPEHWYFALSII